MTSPSQNTPQINATEAINFIDACQFWFKLGLISFGGPAGQIAMLHQECVVQRRWISERRFLHALNFCMLLPGPEAQQLATYLGWLMHKTKGGIVAGVLFILPSLVLLIALSWLYIAFGQSNIVSGIFFGIKPAVVAIVLQAAIRLGSKTLKNSALLAITIGALLSISVANVPFPLIILSAGVIGFVGGKFAPRYFNVSKNNAAHLPSQVSSNSTSQTTDIEQTAFINDLAPRAEHTRFNVKKLMQITAIFAVLWCVPMAVLVAFCGWQHPLTHMAWFFTKAALLTFGGAYAVLPYVMQNAVGFYGWLTPPQMMDGLALGETTPGPLIIVVAFVGFIGGYTKAVCGADNLMLGATLAACLVTWFTFLPSFFFIFAGAPLIESTHNNLNLTAPLTAISAAVLGVMLNLCLFFAVHVLLPNGINHHWQDSFYLALTHFLHAISPSAAVITFIALVLLLKFKQSVMRVIGVCALLGWVWLQLAGNY